MGVLAYFGYPYAHEDDAERSVLGLALVEAVPKLNTLAGTSLQVRVGIATGLSWSAASSARAKARSAASSARHRT